MTESFFFQGEPGRDGLPGQEGSLGEAVRKILSKPFPFAFPGSSFHRVYLDSLERLAQLEKEAHG